MKRRHFILTLPAAIAASGALGLTPMGRSVIKARPVDAIIPRDVFILAGQSNMSGRGLLSEVPAFANAPMVKVYSNAGAWVGGYEPTDDSAGQVDSISLDASPGAGPGMAFANALAGLRPGREVGLVPCAKGSTNLDQWARNLSRSTLYGSMIARAKEAAAQGVLKGLIFYQGENDADTLDHANTWDDRCYDFIANVRSDLGISDLAVIVTALGPDPGNPSFPYHANVRSAQLAMTGSNLAVVTAADLTGKSGDTIHLNTASQMILGDRYASAMNALLGL